MTYATKVVRRKQQACRTHKISTTKVVQLPSRKYGVAFEFDDGYTDFAEVGSKETSDFYAALQRGEDILMRVNPVLLSAAKAETLGQR